MGETLELSDFDAMLLLGKKVKEKLQGNHFNECREIIMQSMGLYPDAPEPHNFYGILMEMNGKHLLAMKHFRASADLDPTYEPAIYNMEACSTFYTEEKSFAFNREDCTRRKRRRFD